jgi:hypothetical protein
MTATTFPINARVTGRVTGRTGIVRMVHANPTLVEVQWDDSLDVRLVSTHYLRPADA